VQKKGQKVAKCARCPYRPAAPKKRCRRCFFFCKKNIKKGRICLIRPFLAGERSEMPFLGIKKGVKNDPFLAKNDPFLAFFKKA